MIRMEPNVVLKYFDPVDAFVKIRHFTADEVTHLLKTARITDRRSYVGLVVNACVLGLTEKHLDLVVFNDVSREDIAFDSSENEVVLVSAAGERTVPKAPKERIAAEILDEVERLLGGR